MANNVGKGFQYGFASISFAASAGWSTDASGWIMGGLRTGRLTHNVDMIEDKSQSGVTDGLCFNENFVEWSITYALKGSSVANALLSGAIPQAGRFVTISSAPVVIFAGFADVYNSANWVYIGGAEQGSEHNGIWVGQMTLRRYSGISAGNFIT